LKSEIIITRSLKMQKLDEIAFTSLNEAEYSLRARYIQRSTYFLLYTCLFES